MKSWILVRLHSLLTQTLVVTASAGLLVACKPTLLDPNKYTNETVGSFLYSPALLTIQAASVAGTSSAAPSLASLSGATASSYSISPSLTSFPFLSFNTTTGAITQTGTAPSSIVALETFTVRANTNHGHKDATIDIQVLITIPAPTLSYSPNPKLFTVGVSGSITPTVGGGGSSSFSISGADTTALNNAGLAFDTSTGTFSGTATSAMAARSITVTATNLGGSATFALTVEARALPTVSYSPSPKLFTVGVSDSISPLVGGGGADSFSISSTDNAALSIAGLSFNTSTGVISGSATSAMASRAIVITATNTVGSATFSLTVEALVAPTLSYSPNPKLFPVGTPASISPTATGTALSYSISSGDETALDTIGLSFNPTTGVISGTATSAMGSRVITITAANTVGSVTFDLTVEALVAASISYSPNPKYFTVGVSDSITPTVSGTSNAYSIPGADNTALNAIGLSFNTSTGAIGGTASAAMASRAITVTVTNSLGSASVSLTVAALIAPTLSYTTPKYFTVGVNDSISPTATGTSLTYSIPSPDNIALVAAGLSFNTSTGVLGGTASAAMASRAIVVTASNAVGSATFSVTVAALVAPSLSYVTPKYFTVGVSSSISPTASGTNLTFSIPGADNTALNNAGLSFSTSTGVFSGSATSAMASRVVTVTATNLVGSDTFAITVEALIAASISYSPSPKNFTVGVNDSISPSATGSSLTYSIPGADNSALVAAGLSFNTSTGVLGGTASAAMASRVITITATNALGSTTFDLTVAALVAPTLSYVTPKYFTVGVNDVVNPTFTGTAVAFSIPGADNTALGSAGLSFSPMTGEIGGTATSAMASRVIVVTAANDVGSVTFSITVAALVAPTITYAPATKYFTVGTNSSISPTVAGTNLTFSIPGADNSALFAAGLSFNTSTGVFSGSATSAMASRVITITATNLVGSDSFPLTVEAQAAPTLSYVTPKYFTVGVSSSVSPTATGTSLTYSIPGADNSALVAAGLSFNTSTGVFSGSATSVMASRSITVTAMNAVNSATFAITVEAQAAPTLSYVTPNYFTVGVSDTITPTSSGTNVSFSIPGADNSALVAAGLSFSVTTGVIGGSATSVMASRAIVVTASNSVGSVNFTVTVAALSAATISYSPTTKYFAVSVADSITPTVSGTSVTYSIPGADNTALSNAGLSFSTSTGAISGTASAVMASRTITVTATNSVGSTTANITVIVFANPTKLILSGATTGITTDCITYTMQAQDSTSTATNVTADRTVTLGGAGTGGTFYSTAGCTGSISSLTLTAGTSQTTFYYRKTSPGAVTLTGTSAPLTAASLGVTISVAPPTAVTLTGTTTPTTASCAAYTITTKDSQGNASPVSADRNVTLSDGAAAGDFYSSSICNFGGSAITSTTVLNGASTAVVYYKMPSTGSSTLSAVVATIATGTLTINVGISTAAKLTLVLNPSTTQTAGSCIEITINTRDAGDNLIDLTSGITVNLTALRASDSTATGTFYSTAGCSGTITNTTMASGTQSKVVYYTRTVATVATQATNITAAKSGGGFADGTASINFIPGLMFKLVWETVPTANTMQAYNLLNWSGATTPLVNAAVCSRFRLKVQDQYNNDTTTSSAVAVTLAGEGDGAWYDDADTNCDAAFSGASFTSGAATSNYFRYRKPTNGTVSFTAAASGAATTPASVNNVSTGTPDRVVYNNPPTTAKAGACTGFAVEIRDSSNIIIPAPKSPGYSIALSGGGVDGTFHSANTCTGGNQITSATVAASAASVTYYFKKLTASAPSAVTLAANETTTLTDATDRSVVISTGGVTNIAWTTAPNSYNVNSCQSYTITSRDENNLASNPGTTINIALSTSAGDGSFYASNANCTAQTSAITSTSITTGINNINVFYRKNSAATGVTITADATGWITQTRTVTGIAVNAVAATPVLSFTGSSPLAAGTCSSYTVSRTGATTAAVAVTLAVTGGATGIAYYVDAACTLAITGVNLAVGSATTSPFYVMGAIAESGNLRATATSHTTGNRAITIN